MSLVLPLLLVLAIQDPVPDLSDVEVLGLAEAKQLMEEGCEHGTVVAPSHTSFEGLAGETYIACYQADHQLLYKTSSAERVGWWHLEGNKQVAVVCRGRSRAEAERTCRRVKRVGAEYFGIGASSGTVRYRFTLGEEP